MEKMVYGCIRNLASCFVPLALRAVVTIRVSRNGLLK